MEFEGNPHCGLDDSYNIARICIRLLEDGAFVDQNERIICLKNPTSFGKDVTLFLYSFNNSLKIFLINIQFDYRIHYQ